MRHRRKRRRGTARRATPRTIRESKDQPIAAWIQAVGSRLRRRIVPRCNRSTAISIAAPTATNRVITIHCAAPPPVAGNEFGSPTVSACAAPPRCTTSTSPELNVAHRTSIRNVDLPTSRDPRRIPTRGRRLVFLSVTEDAAAEHGSRGPVVTDAPARTDANRTARGRQRQRIWSRPRATIAARLASMSDGSYPPPAQARLARSSISQASDVVVSATSA